MRMTGALPQMIEWTKGALEPLVEFVAPSVCAVCQDELASPASGGFCETCRARLEKLPPQRCPACGGPLYGSPLAQCDDCMKEDERPWQVAVSAFAFRGEARRLIHRLKFRRQLSLAAFFADALAENWRAYGNGFEADVVTSVPLHWTRRWLRGYNQAEEVAVQLADTLTVPYRRLLSRTRWTSAQSALTAQTRRRNVSRAFAVRANALNNMRGKRVLLVDDVFTTGATLTAATNALLAGGAAAVAVITIARAV